MHCPNCGSEATMDQNFCRSCGFGLGKVATLIAEQAPDESLDSASGPETNASVTEETTANLAEKIEK